MELNIYDINSLSDQSCSWIIQDSTDDLYDSPKQEPQSVLAGP